MAQATEKVTIPMSSDPFIVEINGKVYSYPAGTEQYLPLEVAEEVKRHQEAQPKPREKWDGIVTLVGAGEYLRKMDGELLTKDELESIIMDGGIIRIVAVTEDGLVCMPAIMAIVGANDYGVVTAFSGEFYTAEWQPK